MKKSIIRENYKGLNPQDSCDYALSNCDKSMIKQINTLSDAWELYQKSWEKFYDIYSLSDIEEMYLNIEDCLDELHKKVIEKWMEDIDIIYYSNNKMSQIKPTFGFKGNDLFESKKSTMKKSIKEYRTVGLEQEVREKCIEILEDSHSDLFELNYSDAIITYANKGRAETTSSGDVFINYITLPLYCWSSGSYSSNKDTKKIIDNIIDYNMDYAKERLWDEHEDELKELGIESKDDNNLEYNSLYELGAGDLAEELSEYEMYSEGTELFTQVSCEITDTDDGIELTVSMLISDEYGRALVKNYKSNSVVITEDTKDIEDAILDCIRSVTENW